MDLSSEPSLEAQDFFEESAIHGGIMLSHTNLDQVSLANDPPIIDQAFQLEPFYNSHLNQEKPKLSAYQTFKCQPEQDETSQFQQLLSDLHSVHFIFPQSPQTNDLHLQDQDLQLQLHSQTVYKQGELEQLIQWLLDHSDLSLEQLHQNMKSQFTKLANQPIAHSLADKFVSLKKTKQQLVKYCMRKAFKFILQLPKNNYLLNHEKQEKYSFSKSKNRYIKQVSQQKSMNKKFLQQIFNQPGFAEDYTLFLQTFETVMREDNRKKVKFLAELLTNQKEGNIAMDKTNFEQSNKNSQQFAQIFTNTLNDSNYSPYIQSQSSYNLTNIQMIKQKDNDIFGTNHIGYAPRIQNNNYIDPNQAFKRKTEENYQKYSQNLANIPKQITGKVKDKTKVNNQAEFDEEYHRVRKETDMQSSIFYPPTPYKANEKNVEQQYGISSDNQMTFGRKQTLSREIKQLPFNKSGWKGNSSRLFDLDERIKPKIQQHISIDPLIPHQMQWDQHDSVKYAHINSNNQVNIITQVKQIPLIASLKDIKTINSQQTVGVRRQTEKQHNPVLKNNIKSPVIVKKGLLVGKKDIEQTNRLRKIKSQGEISRVDTLKTKEPVQVKILKGWDYKWMEGLSKQCKLNGTAILKFQIQEEGKASLSLKRSERWENVTDWLRKDAKMKIRVLNN